MTVKVAFLGKTHIPQEFILRLTMTYLQLNELMSHTRSFFELEESRRNSSRSMPSQAVGWGSTPPLCHPSIPPPDLSRDKSGRACLPPAGAFRARPGRRAPIYDRQRQRRPPCPPAHASGQSDRGTRHWRLPFRSSGAPPSSPRTPAHCATLPLGWVFRIGPHRVGRVGSCPSGRMTKWLNTSSPAAILLPR